MLLFDSRLTRRSNAVVTTGTLLCGDGILFSLVIAIDIGYDNDDTRYIKIFSSFVCDILLSLLFTLTSNLLQYDDDWEQLMPSS